MDCGPGRYAPLAQTDECLRCSPGRFTETYTSSSCLDCETELGLGSGSVEGSPWCRECRPGYFYAGGQTMTGHHQCKLCPDGADCNDKGSTLATLMLKPNFFRFSDDSDRIYECEAKMCIGGNGTGNALCEDNHVGPKCALCAAGYVAEIRRNFHK